jgi:hypothetical protein
MDELVLVVEDRAVEVHLHEGEDLLQDRVERRLVRADDRDRELGPLVAVLVRGLGARNLELVADAALQAPENHALLLQPAAAGKVQVEDGVGEDQEEPLTPTERRRPSPSRTLRSRPRP